MEDVNRYVPVNAKGPTVRTAGKVTLNTKTPNRALAQCLWTGASLGHLGQWCVCVWGGAVLSCGEPK